MIGLLVFCLTCLAPASISGVVHDASGGAVPGATVIVRPASGAERQTLTGPDGRFTIDVPDVGDLTLVVRAGGFAEKTERLSETDRTRSLDLVVQPAALLETVTVTPTRSEQRLGDIPASVSVLTADDIRSSPAVVADDVLRQIPTFSLFRRSSSLSTHPTSQGVSLRGIGPSGVSRTLVLRGRHAVQRSVRRLGVLDARAARGDGPHRSRRRPQLEPVRQLRDGRRHQHRQQPSRAAHDRAEAAVRQRQQPEARRLRQRRVGQVGVTVDATAFKTDGFPIVAPSERGLIDNNATVSFHNVNAKARLQRERSREGLRSASDTFGENRGNGKIGEVNDTQWTSGSGGVRIELPDQSDLQASVFADIEHFHSTFLAVTPPSATVAPRSIVRLSVDQHVPTARGRRHGAVVEGARTDRIIFSAGTDWHWVDGDSQEGAYNAAPGPVVSPTQSAVLALQRVSGGTQRIVGVFVQDILTPLPKLTVTLSARVDHWLNYDAHNLETAVIPGTPVNNQPLAAGPERHGRSVRAPRRGIRSPIGVSAWGDIGSGLPRADAQRALSPVPGRHRADAAEQSTRPRAPGRRRSGRQPRARRAT